MHTVQPAGHTGRRPTVSQREEHKQRHAGLVRGPAHKNKEVYDLGRRGDTMTIVTGKQVSIMFSTKKIQGKEKLLIEVRDNDVPPEKGGSWLRVLDIDEFANKIKEVIP